MVTEEACALRRRVGFKRVFCRGDVGRLLADRPAKIERERAADSRILRSVEVLRIRGGARDCTEAAEQHGPRPGRRRYADETCPDDRSLVREDASCDLTPNSRSRLHGRPCNVRESTGSRPCVKKKRRTGDATPSAPRVGPSPSVTLIAVAGEIDHDRRGQDENIVLPGGDIDAVGVREREPLL